MKKLFFTLVIFAVFCTSAVNAQTQKEPWKQTEFVISTFHAVPGVPNGYTVQMLIKCKEAGVNYVETPFTAPDQIHLILETCEALGMKVIVHDADMFGGYQDIKVPAKTDEEIEKSIDKAMETYGKYKSLAGFYIWDEPYHNQLPLVSKTLTAFKKKVPDKLLFIGSQQSASPSYKWFNGTFKAYIDDYLNMPDLSLVCSNYSYFYEMDKTGVHIDQTDIWDDLGYLRRAALRRNLPFWYYVTLVGDPTNHSMENQTIEKVRFAVNNLLAFGVKGISYYITETAIYDIFGREMPMFKDVKKLNQETLVVGNYMLGFKSKLVYSTAPNLKANYIDKISDSPFVKSATKNLMFGEFESENKQDYIFIMSRDFEKSYKGSVSLKKKYRIDKLNRETGKLELISKSTDKISIDYIPSEGNLYRISAEFSEPTEATQTTQTTQTETQQQAQTGTTGSGTTQATGNTENGPSPFLWAGGAALIIASAIAALIYLLKKQKNI